MPVLFFTGYLDKYIMINIIMLLHELGHISMAAAYRMKIHSIRILPVGINAQISNDNIDMKKNIIVFAAGPAVNILFAVTGLIFNTLDLYSSKDMLFFISVNLYLTVFNLLPLIPLDGGMILREIMMEAWGIFLAGRRIEVIGRITAIILAVLGICQYLFSRWNISIILIGVYVFFSSKESGGETALMNIKNIIYRRERLIKKGIYQARHLVALKSMHIGEIIRNMDFDRFHIIYVLDDRLNVIKVLTEQQILDGAIKYNSEMTFEDFVNAEQIDNSEF